MTEPLSYKFEPTTGTQVLATRCCCCCCVLRCTGSLTSCVASSLLLIADVRFSGQMQKAKTHKKDHFETSLKAADFYTNQHETSFCHFVLENEEKLALEMFILILEKKTKHLG